MASGSGNGGDGHGHSHGGGHRAEAERWLSIAQKLLISRDLQGTKSFAIRARDSDPSYEQAHQLVAVVDTLLSTESGISTQSQPFDWYAVLQLPRLCPSVELAATQYRKLALLLATERNPFPFADHAFRLVCEAWSVLSNPAKKAFYDSELQLSQLGQRQQLQNQHTPQPIPAVTVAQPPPVSHQLFGAAQQSARSVSPTFVNSSPITPVRRTALPPLHKQRTPSSSGMEFENENIRQPLNSNDKEKENEVKRPSQGPSFWTACPYCYILYEYPKMYEECTLRCQKCRRAFQAVVIPSPPVNDGSNFCCWGFFPIGFSGDLKDLNSPGWTPFSSMFVCPGAGNGGKPKRSYYGPRTYYDKDACAAFVELSDSGDDDSDDDDEWDNGEREKKAAKNAPYHRNAGKDDEAYSNRKVVLALGNKETNQKGLVGNSGRKQMAKGMKDLGKLDLNVEFSNEFEEAAARGANGGSGHGHGHGGEEDPVTAGAFFEGLDEFLSSLPILNVVGDDKVKAS